VTDLAGRVTFTGFISASSLVPHSRPALYALPCWAGCYCAGLRAVLYLIMRGRPRATFSVLLVLCILGAAC